MAKPLLLIRAITCRQKLTRVPTDRFASGAYPLSELGNYVCGRYMVYVLHPRLVSLPLLCKPVTLLETLSMAKITLLLPPGLQSVPVNEGSGQATVRSTDSQLDIPDPTRISLCAQTWVLPSRHEAR